MYFKRTSLVLYSMLCALCMYLLASIYIDFKGKDSATFIDNNKSLERFSDNTLYYIEPDRRYAWMSKYYVDHSRANQLPYVQVPRYVNKTTDFENKYHALSLDKFKRFSIGVTIPKNRTITKGYLKGWPESNKDILSSYINPATLDYDSNFAFYAFNKK